MMALQLIGGVLLLLGNAFFVTTEFALTRVRQFDAAEFDGSARLRRAWHMTEELEIYLSGCQVGITVCSVGLGVVAEPAVVAVFDPVIGALGGGAVATHAIAVTLALVVINLLHVIVGEQAPTYLGIERTKFVAHYLAPGLYWWTRALSPVIRLADAAAKALLRLLGVSITRSWVEGEDEEGKPLSSISALREEMGRVLRRGALSAERQREIMNALQIGAVPVRDIMVPREEIVVLTTAHSTEDNLARIREEPYNRYPLIGDSWDEVHGTIYLPAVFRALEALRTGTRTLADLANEPVRVPADMAVSDFIDRLQEANQELAYVEDATGTVLGIVTATDAFEAIAGELEDPIDAEIIAHP